MKNRLTYLLFAFIGIFLLHMGFFITGGLGMIKICLPSENASLVSQYFRQQEVFLGLSYAFAGTFTLYAFLKFLNHRKNCLPGVIGGMTLMGAIYFVSCFFLGCCGSPMLFVYLGFLGPSLLGLTKPLVFILTIISVVVGFYWLQKSINDPTSCCVSDKHKGG